MDSTHRSLVDPAPPTASSAASKPPRRPRGRPPRKPRSAAGAPPTSLEIAFERDLCTSTYDEIVKRWPPERRAAYEAEVGKPWALDRDHQFVYYLAERVWFDNTRLLPDDGHTPGARGCKDKCRHRYLYAPLHRDRYLRPITAYMIDPTSDYDGVLALGPRDTYKSTLAAALVMAHILRSKHIDGFDARDVIKHHKFTMASRGLRRVAAKFRYHPYMRRYFAEYCPAEDVKQFGTQDEFTLPNAGFAGEQGEATCRAVGATASDTGSHVDLCVNDDLVTEDHINSKAIRDESKIKYEASQFTRDTVGGKEVNFGTPYHVNDLWAAMIKSNVEGESRYKIIRVPAIGTRVIKEDGREVTESVCRTQGCGHGPDDHPAVDGVPIELAPCAAAGCKCREMAIYAHPHRLTKAFLEKKMQSELSRSGRIVLWYLQYQCEGKADYQTAAKIEWIVWGSLADIPEDATPIIFVDPAWKGTENQGKGDSASVQVHFFERRGGLIFRWIADGIHSNELTIAEGIKEIIRLANQYGAYDCAPEEHGGYGFRTSLTSAGNDAGVPFNILDLKMKQTGKDQRIVAWLRELQEGRVIFCKEMNPDLLDALKEQIKDVPQLDHDDAIDCAAYSCDPNVVANYTPRFRKRGIRALLNARRTPPQPLSRHCGV